MNRLLASFRHHSLFITVAILGLASSAFADEGTPDRPLRAVDAVVTIAEENSQTDARLPLTLASWTEDVDELDLREAHAISLELFPQARMSTSKPPFIDFSQLEVGGFFGAVKYSADFKAHVDYILGITSRVPVPGLGAFGLYAEAVFGYISRDLPFYYNSKAGNWFGAGIGADYTLVRGSVGYIRPQVGIFYAYWNGINGLSNGIGITVGVQFGAFWIKNYDRTSVTFTPEFQFRSGSDYMIFFPLGFSVNF
jgi:hypothetical protein